MISIFTPAHNTKYLHEVYSSLLCQDNKDFEWVLCLNGKAANGPHDDLAELSADSRVRFIKVPERVGSNIGALRNSPAHNVPDSFFWSWTTMTCWCPTSCPR